MRRLGTTAMLLLAVALAGCGDDAQSSSDNGANENGANRPIEPAPPAGGTLTDDVGKARISIPRIPPWEEYVEQHKAEHGVEPPEPRGRMEIYDEEQALPRLYLTHETNTRVIAPGNKGSHRDAQTGEQCSRAIGCYHPDCPQRGEDGEPFGFIDNWQSDIGRHCPACINNRDVANETPAERNEWARWVRPHELRETAEQLRALTEERRRRIAWERAQR